MPTWCSHFAIYLHMSFSIDHILSIIDDNKSKPRSCIKFPCGICNKTVQQILKQFNVNLVIFGFTLDAMVSLILNMNT